MSDLDDPCDQMVSDAQIMSYMGFRVRAPQMLPDAFDPYDFAASVWGVSREEAKRRCYARVYGADDATVARLSAERGHGAQGRASGAPI